MNITQLKSKISYIKVSSTNLYYDGSLGIDEEIMEKATIRPYEQVHVLNVTNGQRFITYAIKEPRGSNNIAVYGAAAKLCNTDDEIIILTFVSLNPSEESLEPIVLNFRES